MKLHPNPTHDHPVAAIVAQIAWFRFNSAHLSAFTLDPQIFAHTLTFYLSNATLPSSNL
jgi:hypothetical protein